MPHGFSVPAMPEQAPYARHVLICTGAYCDPTGQAQRLYRLLAHKLGELGEYANPVRVKRGVTPCLGVCYGGPLLVVYPEGIWYHHVDETVLDRIVEEHLRQGRPVQEYIFHQLDHLAPDPAGMMRAGCGDGACGMQAADAKNETASAKSPVAVAADSTRGL